MMQRRRATKEELKQGAEEIRQADARMRTEAAALGEEPIEDVKVDEGKSEQVMESLEDGPQQVERYVEEPPKNSPEVANSGSRPGVPSTPPPPHPPELEVKSAGLQTPGQTSTARKSPEVRSSVVQQYEKAAGSALSDRLREDVATTPLFTEEQARTLNELHDRAPWLYQSGRSAFSPYLHRPAFLEHEEDRLREGLSERDRQLQYMRDRLFQEQNEKEV